MQITTIGLDLAKNVFHVVGLNQAGKMQLRKHLRGQSLSDPHEFHCCH